jgi:hypothetical protein
VKSISRDDYFQAAEENVKILSLVCDEDPKRVLILDDQVSMMMMMMIF